MTKYCKKMSKYSPQLSAYLIKNMNWPTNYLFDDNDEENIKNAVAISDDNAKYLATTGTTKDTIEKGDKGMWIQNSIGDDDNSPQISNYFQKMYSKLSCCLGKKQISVPILVTTDDNKLEKKYVEISANDCNIDGIDWYDDNTTELGYNEKCQNLLVRLIAFLDKYDPDNEMIDTYGGCIANKHLKNNNLDIDFTSQPLLYQLADINRKCLIEKCREPDAYKRLQERQNCETTFCQSQMTFTDLDAANLNILGTQIQQTCGASAAISKATDSATGNTTTQDTSTDDISADKTSTDDTSVDDGTDGGTDDGTDNATDDTSADKTSTDDTSADDETTDDLSTYLEQNKQNLIWIIGGILVVIVLFFILFRMMR